MVRVDIYSCERCPNCKIQEHRERTFVCTELQSVLYDYNTLNENCPFRKHEKIYTYLVTILTTSLVINIFAILYSL